jgi:hypothetical protein
MQNIVLATHGGVSADGAALAASLLAARLHVPLIPLVVYAPLRVIDYGFGASYVPSPEDEAFAQGTSCTSCLSRPSLPTPRLRGWPLRRSLPG